MKRENLLFEKKWSILNGWKFNPLNWETKIDIKLTKNNKVTINLNSDVVNIWTKKTKT